MKRVSYLIVGMFAVTCTLGGCGKSERDREEREPGSGTDDKPIESLGPAELLELCEEVNATLMDPAIVANSCRITAVVSAGIEGLFDESLSDADLQASCRSSYDECQRNGSPETCESLPTENCSATAEEYKSCVEDRTALFVEIGEQLPECDALTRSLLESSSSEPIALAEPESCLNFRAKCTGLSGEVASFAEEYCAILEPCCAAEGLGSDCAASVAQGTRYGTFNAEAAATCLAELNQRQAEADFCWSLRPSFSPWPAAIPACERVFPSAPLAPPGGECFSSSDCAPATNGDAVCTVVEDSWACVPTTRGALGERCIGTDASDLGLFSWEGPDASAGALCRHADDLHCDSASLVCVATRALGEECSDFMECGHDAYCDFTTHTCAPRLAVGEACALVWSECAGSAYCDEATARCTSPRAGGEACTVKVGEIIPCDSGSCTNGVCDSPLAAVCGK